MKCGTQGSSHKSWVIPQKSITNPKRSLHLLFQSLWAFKAHFSYLCFFFSHQIPYFREFMEKGGEPDPTDGARKKGQFILDAARGAWLFLPISPLLCGGFGLHWQTFAAPFCLRRSVAGPRQVAWRPKYSLLILQGQVALANGGQA